MGLQKQVDARLLNGAQQPTNVAISGPSPATGPSANAMLAKSSDDHDDHVNVSRLIQGLRSDGATPPAASKSEDQGGDYYRDGEAVLEQKSDGFPNRDQDTTAPAPFHSHVWGRKATGPVPCEEDGGEGKFIHAGGVASAGISVHFSGNNVAA